MSNALVHSALYGGRAIFSRSATLGRILVLTNTLTDTTYNNNSYKFANSYVFINVTPSIVPRYDANSLRAKLLDFQTISVACPAIASLSLV